jgi:hypothetical protein
MVVQHSPGINVRPYSKDNHSNRAGGVAQMVRARAPAWQGQGPKYHQKNKNKNKNKKT